jgi:transcription elongation GreA/GreB family factor
MSRAFTKEIDDAPPPPLEARPISDAANFVTPRGAELIEAETDRLTAALAGAVDGDIAAIQRDLRYWSARRQSMQVITTSATPVAVSFGTTVELKRGGKTMRLKIVGEDEADPAVGLIAWTSPLAQALDGAEAGELIEFEAGGRVEMIEVVSVAAG